MMTTSFDPKRLTSRGTMKPASRMPSGAIAVL